MVILMEEGCRKKDVGQVMAALHRRRLAPRVISPAPRVVLGVVEEMDKNLRAELTETISRMAGVEGIETFGSSWKLVSRAFRSQGTVINVGGKAIGQGQVTVMAGPCAVESRQGIIEAAQGVKERGASFLRGGAFKPRTSPYSFRGLEEEGLKYLAEASRLTGLPVVTEVLTPQDVPVVARYADILQIGTRNMHNFALLEAAGEQDKPVFLKRGLMATVKELLLSAEYILAKGNSQVILCERGVRTFEPETRNTLDISAVPLLKQFSHLPVVVDPSHAAGKRELVPALALAAVAAGADGLMIEVHPNPEAALSDGRQSLDLEAFGRLMKAVGPVAEAAGKAYEGGLN
ncbi:MAG: 3-deoxy-7-phosphoheptulonate synthase [Deltaproteobacteria bacterium]|nr:3-deoxy-7-phosphoheptulonate synthase [Deltaproteobacteria bacterium]